MTTMYNTGITCCDLSPICHPNSPAINIPSALRSFSRHPPPLHLARWPRRATSKSLSSPRGIGHVQPSPPDHRTGIQNQKNVQKSFSLMEGKAHFYCTTWNSSISFIFTLLLSLFTSLSLCKQPGLEISCRSSYAFSSPEDTALAFKFCTRRTREPVEHKIQSAIANLESQHKQWLTLPKPSRNCR